MWGNCGMSQADPTDPIADEEYLYRRVPVKTGWVRDGVVDPYAFRPNVNDVTGLSLERASFGSPEEAARGRSSSGYYITRVKAKHIRDLGLVIVSKPTERPGHVELPGLTYENRRANQAEEWQVQLADLATHEGVLGPYHVGESTSGQG
jgi:hypothetical protein